MEWMLIAVGYLSGAIPFGLLIARWFGKMDIRKFGSGNIGATNVGRAMGLRWFFIVFLLDALKGMIPTLIAKFMFPGQLPLFVGAAAIVGHLYPCYLKFQGGKGVATGLGVVFVLATSASLIAAAVFALTFAIWRMVSLSSMLAAVAFPIAEFYFLMPDPWSTEHRWMSLFSLIIPGLIIYRHKSNFWRLLRGEEHVFRNSKSQDKHEEILQDSPEATETSQSEPEAK